MGKQKQGAAGITQPRPVSPVNGAGGITGSLKDSLHARSFPADGFFPQNFS